MLPVTRCNIARRDGWYEKTSCNPLSGNAEVESQSTEILITYELIIMKTYSTLHYFTNSFCKNVINIAIA